MKISIWRSAFVLAAACMFCVAGEPLSIPWFTIDGGGAMRSTDDDDRFVLSSTIGQPDAGVMEGGDFKLTGGFWFETQLGDCNEDGALGLLDHADFVECLTGIVPPSEGCNCFDVDQSGAVDLADFAILQAAYTGDSQGG